MKKLHNTFFSAWEVVIFDFAQDRMRLGKKFK